MIVKLTTHKSFQRGKQMVVQHDNQYMHVRTAARLMAGLKAALELEMRALGSGKCLKCGTRIDCPDNGVQCWACTGVVCPDEKVAAKPARKGK